MRFSQEYQPANRGRKPGSRNKTNALIDEAAPQIVKKVIEQALQGDTTAANLLLARAVPPLKAVSQPLPIAEKHGSYGELATNLLSILGQGADPTLVQQALQAVLAASKVHELHDLEERVASLESRR